MKISVYNIILLKKSGTKFNKDYLRFLTKQKINLWMSKIQFLKDKKKK
jgi:hypothetical protein